MRQASKRSHVWIVVGWFGDHEWIEEVHADVATAQARVNQLWADRRSEKGPDYAQGLCKFDYLEYEVVS